MNAKSMSSRLIAITLMAALSCAASAYANSPAVAQPAVEMTLLATGSVDIEPDGSVSGYRLDQQAQLPQPIRELADANVMKWRFEPILEDGVAVAARARMNLRFVATEVGEDDLELRLAGVTFPQRAAEGERLGVERQPSTREFGSIVGHYGVEGTVYVAVKVGRDGRLQQAAARQVNLRSRGPEEDMKRIRDAYARAAEQSVRRMRFTPVTAGPRKDDAYWTGTVPFELCLTQRCSQTPPWQWVGYVPGPRTALPWEQVPGSTRSQDTDAMPSSGLQMVDHGIRLLTPLGEG